LEGVEVEEEDDGRASRSAGVLRDVEADVVDEDAWRRGGGAVEGNEYGAGAGVGVEEGVGKGESDSFGFVELELEGRIGAKASDGRDLGCCHPP
jgi:hypothetical protein